MLACTGVHVQQLGWDCQPPERPAQVALSASLGWVMQQPEQVPAGTRVCACVLGTNVQPCCRVDPGHGVWQPYPSQAAGSGLIFSPSLREEKAFENLSTAHA